MRKWDRRAPIGLFGQSPRWSESQARDALLAWHRSGESASAFASTKGFSAQRLIYWRKRFGDSRDSSVVGFSEVAVVDAPVARREIEIAFERVRVRIREDMDAAQLARIVRALAREE